MPALEISSGVAFMPVDLLIENAPDEIVSRLRARADSHGRSLRGEVLAILEDSTRPDRLLSPDEVLAEIGRLALSTPSESVAMIRADRDAR
jgi:plasmid stability protein